MLKSIIRYILDRSGVEVSRAATFSNFLSTRDVDLVVDVGANLGQFAQKARSVGYGGAILSIEPSSEIYAALSKASVKQPWDLLQTALGAERGQAVLNIPANHTLASVKVSSSSASDLLGFDASIVRTERVMVETLDNILVSSSAERIFLKIDTQGYEREVLAGSRNTLQRCVGVLLELPIEHLYDGVWSLSEALSRMDGLGFVPAQIKAVGMMATDPASAIEVDCIFRPK